MLSLQHVSCRSIELESSRVRQTFVGCTCSYGSFRCTSCAKCDLLADHTWIILFSYANPTSPFPLAASLDGVQDSRDPKVNRSSASEGGLRKCESRCSVSGVEERRVPIYLIKVRRPQDTSFPVIPAHGYGSILSRFIDGLQLVQPRCRSSSTPALLLLQGPYRQHLILTQRRTPWNLRRPQRNDLDDRCRLCVSRSSRFVFREPKKPPGLAQSRFLVSGSADNTLRLWSVNVCIFVPSKPHRSQGS